MERKRRKCPRLGEKVATSPPKTAWSESRKPTPFVVGATGLTPSLRSSVAPRATLQLRGLASASLCKAALVVEPLVLIQSPETTEAGRSRLLSSGRLDSNQRPLAPHAVVLRICVTQVFDLADNRSRAFPPHPHRSPHFFGEILGIAFRDVRAGNTRDSVDLGSFNPTPVLGEAKGSQSKRMESFTRSGNGL